MTAVVAFLRAVNIGGRWIKMAELKALFVELGFADAATYVQSGNVVFTAPKGSVATLKAGIEKAIAGRFGFHSETILRTRQELAALVAQNPFAEMAAKDPAHLVVHFSAGPLTAADKAALTMEWAGPEEWRLAGDDLFITYPAGIGPSKLALKIKTPGTRRNWKSVLALAAMADALENSQPAGGRVTSRPLESVTHGEAVMAKGQMKSNKEKRKPKADKNKPKKGGAPSPMSMPSAGGGGGTPKK